MVPGDQHVGVGMRSHVGIARQMLRTLAVRVLHKAFELEYEPG